MAKPLTEEQFSNRYPIVVTITMSEIYTGFQSNIPEHPDLLADELENAIKLLRSGLFDNVRVSNG